MQCHSCGADVRDGQKFCMECGASLRGVADVTGEVPVIRPATRTATVPPPPPPAIRPSPPPPEAADTAPLAVTVAATVASHQLHDSGATSELRLVEATETPADVTGKLPIEQAPGWTAEQPRLDVERPPRPRFRLRPLLVLSVLATAATVVGVLTTLIEIDPPIDNAGARYAVNDFGTNNTAAGLIAAGAMVLGSLAWCFGYRWGAGLAGGAGAALGGWVALLLGLAEWPIATAQRGLDPSSVTRDIGYWALAAAGGLGVLMLLASVIRGGRDGRSGLDPWIAALGGVSFLVAAGGPLIPEGSADWTGNFRSDTLGVDLPTLFFVGRGVQLGLLALCGVVGFLSVRRYGLGLAIGGAAAGGWMLATAATDQTASPIGPAYENPGSLDLQPHAVTIVGFSLVGFFALVAVVMALLDAER